MSLHKLYKLRMWQYIALYKYISAFKILNYR